MPIRITGTFDKKRLAFHKVKRECIKKNGGARMETISYKGKDYSPKSIPDLMEHLRSHRGIEVHDKHARQLINYGYYHAYKGYRFFKKASSVIPYETFDQIIAVIDYDNNLKACFYPQIMFLETALKNIAVAKSIEGVRDAGFDEIYRLKMGKDEGDRMENNRYHLKEKMRQTLAKRYNQDNPVIAHFQKRGDSVPIWGIFEVLSLGDFAMFLKCLDKHIRVSLLRDLKMIVDTDIDAQLLASVVYTIKDLRNALAHNNVVFDTRFQDREVDSIVIDWVTQETKIEHIDFTTIIDYYILISVMLKKIEFEDHKIAKFCLQMREIFDDLYEKTPNNIYTKITTSRLMKKITCLKNYLGIKDELK